MADTSETRDAGDGGTPGSTLSRRAILTAGAAGIAGIAASALPQAAKAQEDKPASPAINTGTVAGMTFKAFFRLDNQPVLEEVRLHELDPRMVLVEIHATIGCYTTINRVLGSQAGPTSGGEGQVTIPNHNAAGVVVAIGSEVRRVQVGDRVLVSVTSQCGMCYQCLHGAPEACAFMALPAKVVGELVADGREVVQELNIGGLAQFSVTLEEYCVPLFTDLPFDQIAMLGDAYGAGVSAPQNYEPVKIGADVVVFGAGAMGLGVIQSANANSPGQIIVVEPIAHRRELATKFGATTVLDPNVDTDTLVDRIKAMCSGPTDRIDAGGRVERFIFAPTGADFVYECSGGDKAVPTVEAGPDPTGLLAMQQAYGVTRGGGALVYMAIGQKGMVDFQPTRFAISTKRIYGGQMGGQAVMRDNPRYVKAAERGRLDIAAAITARYQMTVDNLVAGYTGVAGRTELGVAFDPHDI